MSTTYVAGAEDADQSAVSWAAIFAGGVAAAALTVVLIAFGTAMGFAAVSPWAGSGISATTFSLSAGVYLVVVAMMSSTIGGYIAGRLRSKWTGARSQEVLFRDTAHGFLAWAFATLLGLAVLGAATTSLLGGVASGIFQGGTQAAAHSSGSPTDYFTDLMLRPAPGAQVQGDPASARREVTTIFARGVSSGDIVAADRTYLAQLVAARTGLSQPEAEKRVNDTITQARAAADAARKYTAAFALWLTFTMLLGAFSASAAAIEGGQLRDGKWRGVIGARRYQQDV
jgi:hypothetical protein